MKIMMVVARLNIGGVALNVIHMIDALQKMPDCEVLLVNGIIGQQEGDMQYLAERYKLQQVVLPSLGRELSPLRDLYTLWQLWRLMRRYRPDVVHTHTAKAGWVGRWAAFLAGVRGRVHTFHGHVFSGYFSPRKTALFLLLERIAARLSTRIITLSDTLREELAVVYHVAPVHKIAVIPLGLDLQPFANIQKITGENPVIGVVGRLVPIKNHALFLDAAALLHAQHPAVRFLIIGDGELRAELAQRIEALGLADVVQIVGWVQDVVTTFAALDLVTITSDNEGTPVSLLEALAAGIPVVSTDVGGVRDLFGAELAAQLVPPRDAVALCAAWQRTLATPPDLTAVRQRILATYAIQAIAAHHMDLYKTLLTEG